MKKVSIIIPVYNRSDLLKEAVSSILHQSYSDYELIVVDDGSDSKHKKQNEKIVKAASEIWIEEPHCGRPSHLRNVGVKAANCDLIAFLDSDDIWAPNKLERQLSSINIEDKIPSSLSACDIEKFLTPQGVFPSPFLVHTKEQWNRGGKIISQSGQRHPHRGDLFKDCLHKCIIGPSTVLMSKKIFLLLGGFNDDIEVCEDYELWLRYSTLFLTDYIEEELIIKRAGSWPSLSEKYGHIEIFRLRALKHYLNWLDKILSSCSEVKQPRLFARLTVCRQLAVEAINCKVRIYTLGATKRGKVEEVGLIKKEFEAYLTEEARSDL